MWWVPLVFAAVLAAALLGLHLVHRHRELGSAKVYRRRFIQLVAQLDLVTSQVNLLGLDVKAVKEPRLLDYYERTLRLLETLLSAMTKIPPFGVELSTLDAAVFLVKDCRLRVGRLTKAFEATSRGEAPHWDELFGQPLGSSGGAKVKIAGCYFCSRPVIAERFTEVKVKVDGESKEVISCKVCRDQLRQSRKLKILHFMRDGLPVHWSQLPDYVPSEEYWQINQPGQASSDLIQAPPAAKGRPPLERRRHLVVVQPPAEAHHPD